ncbi:MAG: 4-hydroxy-tetrahydrodipicolinate reductase [Bacteroidales bacterium]
MRIALIGYGRMGREIEAAAIERGHDIALVIDLENRHEFIPGNFRNIDAAIEFSVPASAFENVARCIEMKIPVVSGTTGWAGMYDEAARLCREKGSSFIHSSNFSIGVNILFRLNSELARLMEAHESYTPYIEEIHHTRKLDAPSGTAISLASGISSSNSRYKGWQAGEELKKENVVISSVREGDVPGTHMVEWDSEIDSISLKHVAKGRKGFATGAVVAAEFIKDRRGVFTMADVLGF